MPQSTASEEREVLGDGAEVYAIAGADPEVLAYAMARYSRSSLSMKESLAAITRERAEKFFNTFYFQYGHRSIADLAHVAFAIERLSLLAAIELVDEPRWDGQERSTRYQNFERSGWRRPDFSADHAAEELFRTTAESSFAAYREVSSGVLASLKRKVPRPETMKPETWERTLGARSFDVARYLLPLATNTSLGEIVNARTLEGQISRLASSEFAEVRALGGSLRQAAAGTAWNAHGEALAALQSEIAALDPALGERARELLTRAIQVAPTLVKYAAPNQYAITVRGELRQAARELLHDEPVDDAPTVDLIGGDETLEVELATTLLYGGCHYPYRQIRRAVEGLDEAQVEELIDLGARGRGAHDELVRGFRAGQALRFDILMDIGGFRDLHRHRRTVQILQDYTAQHGFEVPEGLAGAGLESRYRDAMNAAHAAAQKLAASHPESAAYLLPLGTRRRALFKMDFAEALYIAELRSAPQGHFSYRKIAWEMYRAVAAQHPALARHFRVTDIREPVDLLKR